MCKGKRKAVSKITAVLLAMMMVVTFVPTFAFAGETGTGDEQAGPPDQVEPLMDESTDQSLEDEDEGIESSEEATTTEAGEDEQVPAETEQASTESGAKASAMSVEPLSLTEEQEELRGSGTAEDPYLIGNEEELRAFAEMATAENYEGCAKLTADIELTKNWTSIKSPSVSTAYKGVFDGDGHKISNVTISGSGEQGFFGFVKGGTIKNLTIIGSVTSNNNCAGGVVGKLAYGNIENCSFKGEIITSESARNGYAGGVVGYEGYSGTATLTSSVSGCSNYGSVTGNYAGGITGYAKFGTIINCYNSGSISGTSRSGGIAGQAQNNVTIENAYSIGANNGSSSTKADIVDFLYSSAKAVNCYGEKINGTGTGTVTGGGVINKATLLSDLNSSAFAADANGINDGYPILAWEGGAAPQPKDPKIKITGNAPLYMTNSGSPANGKLTISFVDMDAQGIQWSVESGSDVIRISEADDAGDNNISQVVTPLKAGKATVKAQTTDGTYTDEAEISVYPHITTISMNGNPIAGEEYSVDVSTYNYGAYDYDQFPTLELFTWKYFDSRSDYQSNPSGGTVIKGKGPTITVPAELAGKWLTVTLQFKGDNMTPGTPYGKDILSERVPVTGASIEGATASEGGLTAVTGTTLKAVATGDADKTPTNVTYQWAEKAADAADFTDIEGATGQTYKVPDKSASLNKEYRVTIKGENDSTATSEAVKITELSEAAQAAAQDENVLKEAIGKYDGMSKLTPKFGENDNNVAKFLQADLAAKGYEGIAVKVKGVAPGSNHNGVAAIAENGDITWFYPAAGVDPTGIWQMPYSNMAYARFEVTFTLTKGDAESEMTKNVDLNWDADKLCEYLQQNVLDAITWDTIKGDNTGELTAISNLSLPVYPKDLDSKLISMTWTSDNPDAIEIKDPTGNADQVAYGDRIGKVKRGTEDKTAKLTVNISYAKIDDGDTPTKNAVAQLKKEFNITVPAYTQEEIEKLVTNELNQKIDTALEKKGLRDYTTKQPIVADNVTGDIQFPTTTDLKIDGSVQPVTITSNNSEVIDYPRDENDQTKPQKNAARVYVYRPLPGSEAQDVTLTMTITDNETGVAVSREFPVKVQPLTEEEINDAKAFMTKAVKEYWEGLKGTNTDPAKVSSNLTPFQEIQMKEDGSLGYAYKNTDVTDGGIKADRYVEELTGADSDYRRFNLSDNTYINDDSLTLKENLPEKGAKVTIDSYLTHAVYGDYYTKYKAAGNTEAAELFKPFYRQHAEVTITIQGPHVHKLVHYNAKAATATADGNTEYWLCPGCGKYFADENGTKELTKADVTIAKKGTTPKKGSSTTKNNAAKSNTPAKTGTVLNSGNSSYTVTSADKKNPTVALKSTKAKGTLTVPATVTVGGVKYKVTAIAPKAFFKNKKLKKVNVGSNIITIGSQAFSKCKKLKKVTIGSNVTTIGSKCFAGSKKLKTLTVKSTKLTKSGVKNSLKKSKIKRVKVKVGSKKLNKQYVKKYKKFFTKKNCGKKVKVKR